MNVGDGLAKLLRTYDEEPNIHPALRDQLFLEKHKDATELVYSNLTGKVAFAVYKAPNYVIEGERAEKLIQSLRHLWDKGELK